MIPSTLSNLQVTYIVLAFVKLPASFATITSQEVVCKVYADALPRSVI